MSAVATKITVYVNDKAVEVDANSTIRTAIQQAGVGFDQRLNSVLLNGTKANANWTLQPGNRITVDN